MRLLVLRFACDREDSSTASSTAAGVVIGDGDGLKGFFAPAPPPKTNEGWKPPIGENVSRRYSQSHREEAKAHTQRTLGGGCGRRSILGAPCGATAGAVAVVRRHKEVKQGGRARGDFGRRRRLCQRVRGGRSRRRFVSLVSAISPRRKRGPGP